MKKNDKEEIAELIRHTITVVVNGKIDRLTDQVKNIHVRLHEQDEKMEPALETIATLRSGRKFINWVLPMVTAVGAIYAVVKSHF